MRLDHVSHVTSHDQLADTVQRLGSRLGSTFVDGGIHPHFGTRNFTTSIKNGQYIEVVCPLDHPLRNKHRGAKLYLRKLTKVEVGSLGYLAPKTSLQLLQSLAAKQSKDIVPA